MKAITLIIAVIVFTFSLNAQNKLTGFVGEENDAGTIIPLVGANVIWAGTSIGTTTDNEGKFSLLFAKETSVLVVSFVGYEKVTMTVTGKEAVNILLKPDAKEIGKVEVTGNRAAIALDYFGIENKSIITQKELLKAACCNLSESFETNPSIDVSFSDAITGAKQIEMLGLSGIYTQTTMENLPYLRGLFSAQGLTFIPGTWMHSINVSKGIGSVANGFESIAGQIDIEMQKPFSLDEKPLYLNLYSDYDQRYEGNLNYRSNLSEHLSAITLLHSSVRKHQSDVNGDGFTDLPVFETYNIMQRWFYYNENGIEGRFGFQYVKDDKEGGTMSHGLQSIEQYQYKNKNDLFNFYVKTGYVFPEASYKSFGLQLSYTDYENTSLFGLNQYSGNQKSFYANLIYQSIITEETLQFRTGISFMLDEFNETYSNLAFKREETIPGSFIELTYKPDEKFSLVTGLRADVHNFYGVFFTPRLHLRYSVTEDLVIRLAAGKGFRTSNIFAEHSSSLISARQLNIVNSSGFGYGLEQEEAWNFGFNTTYYFLHNYRDASFTVDLYRTQFKNITIANLDFNPQAVNIYSANNGAYSNSVQAELNIEPVLHLQTRIAYRYLDVRQKLINDFVEKPFTSKHRALINFSYSTEWINSPITSTVYDLTLQWFDKKRIPRTSSNPERFQARDYSPAFFILNAQITGSFSSNFDLYVGAENILNFRQDDPIISADNVSSKYFDASLVWGPISGRMIYAGLRYKM